MVNKTNRNILKANEQHSAFTHVDTSEMGFFSAALVPLHAVHTPPVCMRVRVCLCICVRSCVRVTHSLPARGHFDSSLYVDCTEVWQVHH